MTEIYLGNPPEHIKNWIIEHSKPKMTPLCFEALEDEGASIALGYWDNDMYEEIDIPDSISFVYSTDDQATWQDYVGQVVDLNKGEKVYFKAKMINDNLATIWNEDYE